MKTQFTIAYRCAECGKIEFRHISIFELSGKKSLKVYCACGYAALAIHTKDYKNFMLNIQCVICTIPHIFYLSLKELTKEEPILLCCIDYDLELCFAGQKNRVEEVVDKYEQDLEEFINELGYDDYFVSSEIMMESLNILHDLAENKDIICDCGDNDIGVTLLSDKIELRCPKCRNTYMIPAQGRGDVERLKESKSIFMEKSKLSLREVFHVDPT